MKEKLLLKKETVYLIKAFYIIVCFMYFVALMTLSCCAELFPDSATRFFWFCEIMNCSNRILLVGIIVCFCAEKII